MLSLIIENILKDDIHSRSSDKRLMLKVWQHYGLYLTEAQRDKFFSCPSSETVRRTRQKLQEEGKYPALDRIAKSRRLKSYRMQQVVPNSRAEKIDHLINDPFEF